MVSKVPHLRRFLAILAALAAAAATLLPGGQVAHADGPEATKIRVQITDTGFNDKSDLVLEATQGQLVEITFVFAQTIDLDDRHIVALKGYGLETDEINYYNRESTLKFMADKPGTFEFACELDCKIHDKLKSAHLKINRGGATAGSITPSGGSSPSTSSAGSSGVSATALSVTPSAWNVADGPVILTATLMDATGKAVPKADVIFSIEAEMVGTKGFREIGAARTDKDGTAQLVYQPTTSGEQQFLARFQGMGLYGESEQSIQVQVSGEPPNYVIAPASLNALREKAAPVLGLVVLGVWSAYGFALYQGYRIARGGNSGITRPQKEG